MNKLEQLIKELCPDGVEYTSFKETCQYIRGVTYKKTQEAKDNDINTWKVLRANNITINLNMLNFDDIKMIKPDVKVKKEQILQKNDILMCAGSGSKEHIGKVAYIFTDMNYTFGGFMAVVRCCPNLNSRFLFYIFTSGLFSNYLNLKLNSSTINNLNASVINNFMFPFPPLEIQEEIVRILDEYSASVTALQQELEAELTARKKQYEYYRDLLLDFGVHGGTSECEWRTLKEIAENCDSKRKPVTKGKRTSGIYPYYGASGIVDYVDDYIFDGDYLLVSEDGANLLARVTPIAFSISGKNWVNNHAHVLRFDTYVTRRFVEIYLNSINLEKYISTAAQPKLTQDNLNKIPIPYPPIEEQIRIVNILDRFDKLCNDISEGLPAEIEARRKQYEYYRDKLLSFEELSNA